MNIIVSACLLGLSCRYDGCSKPDERIISLIKKHNIIPVCPEIMGGLSTPRRPCEIINGRVFDLDGTDRTDNYTKGAYEVLKLCKIFDVHNAILKERSPSCGYGKIYDGTFSDKLVDGNGITARVLSENGIRIVGESKL